MCARRTAAEYEEQLCGPNEAKERERQILDAVFKTPRVGLHPAEAEGDDKRTNPNDAVRRLRSSFEVECREKKRNGTNLKRKSSHSEIYTQVTATVYQNVLEDLMIPSAEDLYGDADFIFQKDLAPARSARSTKT
ncbi:uncharacterized protein LOC133489829 isoform X3 [Phyllopteryx taeniolatus]|uniref:uncharacterized protein LOC133489829 isoform X3 n=1 Tax=Phyllopteryx taeniolatus TaxID=161469 RepID=UPI002AD4FEC5|nr:uncharacterized protein LOC133489829 isoform X3 [Phyllopteryx taeniolatus]